MATTIKTTGSEFNFHVGDARFWAEINAAAKTATTHDGRVGQLIASGPSYFDHYGLRTPVAVRLGNATYVGAYYDDGQDRLRGPNGEPVANLQHINRSINRV
jgi:hypothetical protein